jgi:hypothetical protein
MDHIPASAGDGLRTFSPAKQYQSIAFSSPELVEGSTMDVYTGGSATGAVTDGLVQGGTYAPGTAADSPTHSGIVMRAGSRARRHLARTRGGGRNILAPPLRRDSTGRRPRRLRARTGRPRDQPYGAAAHRNPTVTSRFSGTTQPRYATRAMSKSTSGPASCRT